MLENSEIEKLILASQEARKSSYCKYSGYAVGAALLCKDGTIFKGCNIENSSYGATNCAERTAIFKAVSEGYNRFDAICIIGGLKDEMPKDYAFPCGICRQVMSEFCDNDFIIIVAKSVTDYKLYKLSELLPESFSEENLV